MREEESDACLFCLPATAPCARHSLSVKWEEITTIPHGTGVEIRLDHTCGKAGTCARSTGLQNSTSKRIPGFSEFIFF